MSCESDWGTSAAMSRRWRRLHTGYRRGSPPGFRNLVPGDASGKGINEEPKRWASYFWSGDPEYAPDEKWWDAVRIAEEARKKKGAEVTEGLERR